MAKRTQFDYVKMFQDSLNGFVQDLHPLGGMATAVITVVEMINSEGKYFLHVIDDGKSPNWKLKGMLDAAHIQLDDKEFDEDED
jgi:hypothetical protein